MKKENYNVAVVGATGLVGQEILSILEERNFPVGELKLLASERSAGTEMEFCGKQYKVEVLAEDSFEGTDIGLFSPGGAISAKFAPLAVGAGAVVIDNTSHFRMDPHIPLVVPEVNAEEIADYKNKGIIANPNCSTIQMVVALKPIYDEVGIERIVVSSYQAVSGAGKEAIDELHDQIVAVMNQQPLKCETFPYQIAFNCIPQIDSFLDNGYTKEEMKLVNETRKIFGDDDIRVTATTVRVPVFFSHSESVNIQTEEKISVERVKALLQNAPGVQLVDNPSALHYPLAIDSAGNDEVFVGRIREDESEENGLNLWVVSDNVRKGAALNAVQIAEELIEKYI
ncbi:MAG: aspartate-semialdehyde dehydrogenase [Deltaproteobacteria bacterium]|nr:aspartate-semialdehyde dehydrogenase [Deltaproteobacteria bacterium]